jgi:hypothetical protein
LVGFFCALPATSSVCSVSLNTTPRKVILTNLILLWFSWTKVKCLITSHDLKHSLEYRKRGIITGKEDEKNVTEKRASLKTQIKY